MSTQQREYTCGACSLKFELKRFTIRTPPLCPSCLQAEASKRAAAAQYWKRDEYRQRNKAWRLKRYYNLTVEEVDQLKEQQANACAICKTVTDLIVDHNHKTGAVRGLLCQLCNRALGSLGDNLSNIRGIIYYLLKEEGWDAYWLEYAKLAGTRSVDPSSVVGAALVKNNVLISTGYNGLPRGLNDNLLERYDRPLKYSLVVHAELNSILNANRVGASTQDTTLYSSPFRPCTECVKAVIQAGITRIVIDTPFDNPRYKEDFELGEEMLREAGVEFIEWQVTG